MLHNNDNNIQVNSMTNTFESENPSTTKKRVISNRSNETDDSISVPTENDETIFEVTIIAGESVPEETLTNDQEIFEGN